MRICSPKKSFAIIGLPRCGSTLLNNILNTYENVFCVSEPHWVSISNPNEIRLGKANFNCRITANIASNMISFLNDSPYTLGGFKETFRLHEYAPAEHTFNSNVDMVIALYREPKANFSAWVRASGYLGRKHYTDVNEYIKNYIEFDKRINELTETKEVVRLKYEDLCINRNEYLNSKFEDMDFEDIDVISRTNFIFGDPAANKGGKIHAPNNNLDNIKNHTEIIDVMLKDIYNKI